MKLFKNFLKIWATSTLCSAVPWLHLGMILGIPAVFLSSVLVTLLFRKELGGG
jgi:hypothetical protein